MGHYGLGHWCVLSLASDFRAVWLVWLQVGERTSGKAFGAKTIRLMLRFSELLNKVCDLGSFRAEFAPKCLELGSRFSPNLLGNNFHALHGASFEKQTQSSAYFLKR